MSKCVPGDLQGDFDSEAVNSDNSSASHSANCELVDPAVSPSSANLVQNSQPPSSRTSTASSTSALAPSVNNNSEIDSHTNVCAETRGELDSSTSSSDDHTGCTPDDIQRDSEGLIDNSSASHNASGELVDPAASASNDNIVESSQAPNSIISVASSLSVPSVNNDHNESCSSEQTPLLRQRSPTNILSTGM